MPRNSNGQYTLPSGNPVVSGEVISTSWANPTMEDIAAEITSSLDRNGRGGMLAPFKNVDGTQSSPGMTWGNEPTTGFYRAGGQDMRAVIGGNLRMRWNNDGVQLWNGTIWSPVVTDATLEANLTAKGYAVKANDEAITGTWTYDNSITIKNAKWLMLNNADNSQQASLQRDATGLILNSGLDVSSTLRLATEGTVRFTLASTGISLTGAFSATGAGSFGGTLGVTGNATFSAALSAVGTITSDTTMQIGGATSSGEKKLRLINNVVPDGVDLLLNSGGTDYGAFRRDTNTWVWQFTLATSTHQFRTNVSVSGTLNSVGTLSQNGTAVALSTTTITGVNSITGGGSLAANRTLQLAGDIGTPGSSWYYGTDASGSRGWYPLSGVVGVPEAPVDGNTYARQNASWVSIGSGTEPYVLKTGDTMTGALTIAANSRGLKLYNTAPAITFQDTDGTVDQRTFDIIQNANTLQFRTLVDSLSTARNALVFTGRTDQNGISNIVLGNTTDYPPVYAYSTQLFVGNNAVTPTATSTRQIGLYGTSGRIEIGLYMNDGTLNPRAAIFSEATGKCGIDWTFSSSVDRFEFRRANAEVFSYNQTGPRTNNVNYNVNSVGGGNALGMNLYRENVQRWLVGMESDAGTNNFRIWRYNTSGTYQGVAFDISAGDGTVAINGPLAAANTLSVTGAATFSTTASFITSNTWATALSVYRATDRVQGLKLFSDTSVNEIAGICAPSNAKGVVINSTTDEANTAPTAGSVYVQLRVLDSINLACTTGLNDSKTDFRMSSNKRFYFYDAANTAYGGLGLNSTGKQLFYNDNGQAKGAVLHWDNSNLQWGHVTISTTDPATTGNPGDMVLVYE